MNEQKHWSQEQENTSTLGIRVLLGIFRLGGRALFHLSLWPVVVFFWLTVSRSRCASRAYLQQMARFTGTSAPLLGSLRHLMRFSDTILDKILAVSGSFGPQDLNVVNADEILNDARGGIIVTAHTGCVELCQAMSETQQARRRLHVLVHTVHAVRFNNLIRKISPQFAVNHIEVTSIGPQTAVELSSFIERGDWIVIVADRTPIGSSSTINISFLGKKAPFAAGPFILAHVLECPAWSMICTRETSPASRARYRVEFSKISEPRPVSRHERNAAIAEMAERWVKTLERALTASPLDWFNFFDFWHPAAPKAAIVHRKEH